MKGAGRKILVTGATGTVGSEVVKQLASSPSSSSPAQTIIRAAIHSQNSMDKLRQFGETIETVYLDYYKPETIAAA